MDACHQPDLFTPHHGLSEQINNNIVQSEIEGGVFLDAIPEGTTLEMETENRCYWITVRGSNNVLICGHPEFCPRPLPATVHGSTWGGSMLKIGFIGRGMRLEFVPESGDRQVITTSRIVDIRAV
jgi:hypothetical protein